MIVQRLTSPFTLVLEKLFSTGKEKKFIINANWLFFEKIVNLGTSLLGNIFIARYLGPENFGVIEYAQAVVVTLSTFVTLGMRDVVLKELVERKHEKEKVLGTSFLLSLLGFVFLILPSTIIFFISNQNNLFKILIAVLSLRLAIRPLEAVALFLESKLMFKQVSMIRILSYLVGLIIKVVLVGFQAPLILIGFSFFIEYALIGCGYIFLNQRVGVKFLSWRVDFQTLKTILSQSWPIFVGSIATMIYQKVDLLIIGNNLTSKSVGFYSSSVKLSQALYFLPTIIGNSAYPVLLQIRKKNVAKYIFNLQKIIFLSTIIISITSLAIMILSSKIIYTLYGVEFLEASKVLKVHIWTNVFATINVLSAKYYFAENLTKHLLIRTILTAFLNLVLNLILIPRHGMIGAAWSSLTSFTFLAIFSHALFKETRLIYKYLIFAKIKKNSHV